MRLGYDLTTEQSQKLVMSPVLLQSLRMLTVTAQELGDLAEKEVLANPVLEEESPYRETLREYLQEYYAAGGVRITGAAGTGRPEDVAGDWYEQAAAQTDQTGSLTDRLLSQLGMTKTEEPVTSLLRYLIDSLDESGYLTVTEEEILTLTRGAVSVAQVEEAVRLLQGFDPAGVGARSAAECLSLQLERRGILDDCYREILSEHLAALSRNHLKEIAQAAGITLTEMQRRADVIRALSPSPGSASSVKEDTVYLLPDVLLEKTDDGWQAAVNERVIPSLKVSAYYESLMKEGAADEETQKYLKERIDSAVRFLRAIALRKETVRKIAQCIADHQSAYLDGGDLAPLTMRQVAEETGVHVSTVSRTVRGKYMDTPKGLLELRSFFSAKLGTEGQEVSAGSAKTMLAGILKEEDRTRPLSDETIAGMMREKGIGISRRTVAKYRGELGIPGSSKRRRF